MTKSGNASENLIRRLDPHKRLRARIGESDVARDRGLQLPRTAMRAAPVSDV